MEKEDKSLIEDLKIAIIYGKEAVDGENKDGIVVSKNNGYGIISLETGREIVPPVKEVSKIYAKTNSKNENEYFVEFNGQEAELSKYAEYVNTISVNVQNNTQTGESTNNN